MARWFAALLALLLLAPSAHAADRLVPAFVADSEIASTGNGFAWTTRDGRLRVTSADGHPIHDVALGDCSVAGATDAGRVLMACRDGSRLLDTYTGTSRDVTVLGEPFGIGRWWIASWESAPWDCCERQRYTNWRTGEVRFGGGAKHPQYRDLDDPDLARIKPRRRNERAIVVGGREIARCRGYCRRVDVAPGRVTYIDSGLGHLVERDLRTGRARRWQLPDRSWLGTTIHRAGGALVVARQTDAGTWRVLRAPRGPSLVHAFDVDGEIQSTGNGFAWTTADAHDRRETGPRRPRARAGTRAVPRARRPHLRPPRQPLARRRAAASAAATSWRGAAGWPTSTGARWSSAAPGTGRAGGCRPARRCTAPATRSCSSAARTSGAPTAASAPCP